MKTVKNYYFILGVSRGASFAEIEAAYEKWKAAAAFDPLEALMLSEKTEAYQNLSDPKLRKQHDKTLGGPPNLSTGGNVHNLGTAEVGVSAQIEYHKEVKKVKSRRKFVKATAAALILLVVVGFGIRHRDRYISKLPSLRNVSVVPDQPDAPHPLQPVPEPGAAPVNAGTAPRGRPVVRTYEIQTGGVVIRDRAPCRSQPSSLSRVTATMRRDAAVFVTGEARDEDGNLWYRVRSSQFEGWASAGDVRVYKY